MYAAIYVDKVTSLDTLRTLVRSFATSAGDSGDFFETEHLDMSVLNSPDRDGEFFGPGELLVEVESKHPSLRESEFAVHLRDVLFCLWGNGCRTITVWEHEELLPQRGRNVEM